MAKPIRTNMKAVRKSAGYTQDQVSKELGIPISTLRKWEQGVTAKPDKYSLGRLADLYGVTVEDFTFEGDEKALIGNSENKSSADDFYKLVLYWSFMDESSKPVLLKVAKSLSDIDLDDIDVRAIFTQKILIEDMDVLNKIQK